ncbi:catenin alpha-like [Pecten maximus]|uniref:catenin alpha-like n=1 Tax=Pecten maximus TaxID=6579 RepID=UPI001458ED57|nr:catenin alpha-like [Pecten maximus]
MEVTNGLLTSFVQTKSIERILAPIASQISLLIILGETKTDVSIPNDIGPCASAMMKAAEHLISVGKEKAQSGTCTDQEYSRRMLSACETLDLASSDLYLATQRLEGNSAREEWAKLVTAAKDVLQGTMKVLLVSDDAEVRRIVSAAHLVSENISRLGMVQTMADLLTCFKSFTDAAAQLCTLANKRQKDLCHDRQREKVITSMALLKKSIPSMSVALQSFVKYPQNPQAQMSKACVMNQVLSAVRDIVEALENKFNDEDFLDVEESGFFVAKVDQILEVLSEDNRAELHTDLESWTETVVRHSMLVAHMCTDSFRDIIIRTCQRILQLKSRVFQLHSSAKDNPDVKAMQDDFNDVCESLMDEFYELERNVNLALLHLVIDIFQETTEPLERLVKSAMYSSEAQSLQDLSEEYIQDFENHADKMCQTARCVAASSSDKRRVRVLRTCVCRLERLDPEMVPGAVTIAKTSCDKMAIKHLKLLMKEWSFEVKNLVEVLDEMTVPAIFLQVSETKIEEDVNVCLGFLTEDDLVGVASALRGVVGRSRRVAQFAERIVDHSQDPLYRNGLQSYIKQLQRAIKGVRAAGGNITVNSSNPSSLETLKKRFKLLIDSVKQVRAGTYKRGFLGRKRLSESGYGTMGLTGRLKFTSTTTSYDPEVMRRVQSSEVMVPVNEEEVQTVHKQLQHMAPASGSYTEYPHARLLGREMCMVAIRGDTQREAVIGGEILGWTNHIVDAAHEVLTHCEDVESKQLNKALAYEVDTLTPKILDKAKLVAHGDKDEASRLTTLVEEWSSKVEKLRIFVDVTVELWKVIADKVHKAMADRNADLLSKEVEVLYSHQKAMSDVLELISMFAQDPHVKDQDRITKLLEDKDEIDNLTVTMATTAEMISYAATREEKNQVSELGRDWAVRMYSVLAGLDNIVADLHQLGREAGVWPSLEDTPTKDMDIVNHLQLENGTLKDLLNCVALGNTRMSQEATVLYQHLRVIQEEARLVLSRSIGSGVVVSFSPQKIRMLSGQWVSKALKCMELIQTQTTLTAAGINKLVDAVFAAKISKTEAQRQQSMADCLDRISSFSRGMVTLRQKILQGIQLSTDISKRSAIRKSLDDITGIAPGLINTLKKLTSSGNIDLKELSRQRLRWAAKVRHLVVLLQQVTDIQPGLVKEVCRLLSVEEVGGVTSCAPDFTAVINPRVKETDEEEVKEIVTTNSQSLLNVTAASARPSGIEEITEVQKADDFKPAKVTFQNVHEELLRVTSDRRDEETLGQLSQLKARHTSSPYRPSNAILAAARYLQKEADKWEDEGNPIVQVAKEMSQQLQHMIEYSQGEGPITNHLEMTQTGKAVAENGQKMRKFAKILAKYCLEKRFAKDLMFYADQIPTVSTQLSIISSVQMASPEDNNADKILIQNAKNLMKVVTQTIKAAETVCVKGLVMPEDGSEDDISAIILATQWRRKFVRHLQREADEAKKDTLGLRRIEEHRPPALTQIFSTY